MSVLQQMQYYMRALIGKTVHGIGRASDMVWILIGAKATTNEATEEPKGKGEYALHIQCPWRLRRMDNDEIVFASDDIYRPINEQEWNDEFEWDMLGNSVFDIVSKQWHAKCGQAAITHVEISASGDLAMQLSNGDVLEIFINTTADTECWRLFVRGHDEAHLVATGTSVSFQ